MIRPVAFTALAAILSASGCTSSISCSIASAWDVSTKLGPFSTCQEVSVYDTDLTDLSILADVDLDMRVEVESNSALTSTVGLGRVQSLFVSGNPVLEVIDVESVGWEVLLHQGRDVRIGVADARDPEQEPAPETNGGLVDVRLFWQDIQEEREVELYCAESVPCRFNVTVVVEDGLLDHEVVMGEGASVRHLSIGATDATAAFLQQFGVPETVAPFPDSFTASEVDAYRQWLQSQGFEGEVCHAGTCS